MRILLVDDEPIGRARLLRLLTPFAEHQVVGEADSGLSGLQLAKQVSPDLVLLDIEMPGLNGLQVANELKQLNPPPAVVFVTAHPQHALAAFAVAPDGYLLKPVSAVQLAECMQRLGVTTRAHLERQKQQQLKLSFRVGHEQRVISASEIFYLHADDKYVRVVYQGGEVLTELSLKSFEESYPALFLRVHRHTLVLKERIAALHYQVDGGYQLALHGTSQLLPVSRRALPLLKQQLAFSDG